MPGGAIDISEMRTRIDSLSPRQRQILILVAQHFTSKEIARLLNVRPATVDNYIADALKRLRVLNRREAATLMIDLGYTTGLPDPATHSAATWNRPRENLPTRRRTLRFQGAANRLAALFRGLNNLPEDGDDDRSAGASNGGTPLALLRFFFDAIYIILFFAVMSSAAYGVDLIIAQWEQRHIDPVVLVILRGVSYVLVILDAIGVVAATGLLTLRFIRSFWRAND